MANIAIEPDTAAEQKRRVQPMPADDLLSALFLPDTLRRVNENITSGRFEAFGPTFRQEWGSGDAKNKTNFMAKMAIDFNELTRRRMSRARFGLSTDAPSQTPERQQFNPESFLLDKWDSLDEFVQDRFTQGAYNGAESQEELAWLIRQDLEARPYVEQMRADPAAFQAVSAVHAGTGFDLYIPSSMRRNYESLRELFPAQDVPDESDPARAARQAIERSSFKALVAPLPFESDTEAVGRLARSRKATEQAQALTSSRPVLPQGTEGDEQTRLSFIVQALELAAKQAEAQGNAQNPNRSLIGEIGARFFRGTVGLTRTAGALTEMAGDLTGIQTISDIGAITSSAARIGVATIPTSKDTGLSARAVAGAAAESIPAYAQQIGAAALTGGTSIGAFLLAWSGPGVAQVVGDKYLETKREYTERGFSAANAEAQAVLESMTAGVVTAATNLPVGAAMIAKFPTADKLMGKLASRLVTRALVGGTGESLQEMSEELLTDSAMAIIRQDPDALAEIYKLDPQYWSKYPLIGASSFVVGTLGGEAAEFIFHGEAAVPPVQPSPDEEEAPKSPGVKKVENKAAKKPEDESQKQQAPKIGAGREDAKPTPGEVEVPKAPERKLREGNYRLPKGMVENFYVKKRSNGQWMVVDRDTNTVAHEGDWSEAVQVADALNLSSNGLPMTTDISEMLRAEKKAPAVAQDSGTTPPTDTSTAPPAATGESGATSGDRTGSQGQQQGAEPTPGRQGSSGVVSSPEGKQPWQMTREEWGKGKNPSLVWGFHVAADGTVTVTEQVGGRPVQRYRATQEEAAEYKAVEPLRGPAGYARKTAVQNALLKKAGAGHQGDHRVLVEAALSEGLHVPPAVLADYPDLKPAAPAENVVQQPWADASVDDEHRWYGTKVSVSKGTQPGEGAFSGTITRVLNGGKLVEVKPDDVDTTFRVESSRITVNELADSASTSDQQDTFRLPSDLAGAKPRYSFGDRQFTLNFESDLDMAAYIIAQDNPSKRDADYLREVMNATGANENEARELGRFIRNEIKEMAREADPGELTITRLYDSDAAIEWVTQRTRDQQTVEDAPNVATEGDIEGEQKPVEQPTIPEPEKKGAAQLKRVSSVVMVAGIEARVADTERIGGVDYEIYAPTDESDQAIIRTADADTGETITIKVFPSWQQGAKEYLDAKVKAKQTTAPNDLPQFNPETRVTSFTPGQQVFLPTDNPNGWAGPAIVAIVDEVKQQFGEQWVKFKNGEKWRKSAEVEAYSKKPERTIPDLIAANPNVIIGRVGEKEVPWQVSEKQGGKSVTEIFVSSKRDDERVASVGYVLVSKSRGEWIAEHFNDAQKLLSVVARTDSKSKAIASAREWMQTQIDRQFPKSRPDGDAVPSSKPEGVIPTDPISQEDQDRKVLESGGRVKIGKAEYGIREGKNGWVATRTENGITISETTLNLSNSGVSGSSKEGATRAALENIAFARKGETADRQGPVDSNKENTDDARRNAGTGDQTQQPTGATPGNERVVGSDEGAPGGVLPAEGGGPGEAGESAPVGSVLRQPVRSGDGGAAQQGSDVGGGEGAAGEPGVPVGGLPGGEQGAEGGTEGASREPDAADGVRGQGDDVLDRGGNHRISATDIIVPTGDIGRIKANIAAIRLLGVLENEGRPATPDEKKVLAQFTGWGATGVAEVLNTARYESYKWYLEHPQYQDGEDAKADMAWGKKFAKHHEELIGLMSSEELNRAIVSTENAHYTSREVIENGLWAVARRLGFQGGRILENSAGIGHVIGLQPEDMAKNSRWTAVELDSFSARMLRKLYPDADIRGQGFQDTKLRAASFDLVIGNVPFASKGPHDKRYPNFSLHNYFLARSLDLVKPGGLVIEITSMSTMDEPTSRTFRAYAAERADLVGAIRLPNTAFKGNAKTEVTTDILIFRRKDSNVFSGAKPFTGIREITVPPPSRWDAKDGEPPTSMQINEYFVDHPEMMLGSMAFEGTMYRKDSPALIGPPGADIGKMLAKSIEALPEKIATFDPTTDVIEGPPAEGRDEFSFHIIDGNIMQVVDGVLTPPTWSGSKMLVEKGKAWINLRDDVKKLVDWQRRTDKSDADIESLRARVKNAYLKIVSKHGQLNAGTAFREMKEDPDYPTVQGLLENVTSRAVEYTNKAGRKAVRRELSIKPAELLTKRTNFPPVAPDKAEGLQDAIDISVSWKGTLDLEYVARLLGKTEDEAVAEGLGTGALFRDPTNGAIVVRDEYLSGNVKQKLREAKDAAAENPEEFASNVKALEEVIPKDKPIGDISFTMGARWIPASVYERWAQEVLGVRVSFEYLPEVGTWSVRFREQMSALIENSQFGTARAGADYILKSTMRMRAPVVNDYEVVNRKRVPVRNQVETAAAVAMQQVMKDNFVNWLRRSDAADEVARVYNEQFNAVIERRHTGSSWTTYPGASPTVGGKPFIGRPHQKAAIARAMNQSLILGHGVGLGKTFTFITLAMEKRRLGLARKPMIAPLNSTVEQMATFARQLYPQAKILVPTRSQFEKKNRQRMLARIASGDFDMIILPHSQFNMIADDPERVKQYINDRLTVLREMRAKAMMEGDGEGGGRAAPARRGKRRKKADDGWGQSPKVKAIGDAIRRLEDRLQKLLDRKVDKQITFEQLGIDMLIMDEAHLYKKLEFETEMDPVKGLDRGFSERGMGLWMKTQYLRDRGFGKNIVLATGTPITNTVAEAWNIIRYVRPDVLAEWGVPRFDDFASAFTERETRDEVTPAGKFKLVTRLSKFMNAPQLATMFRSVADIKFATDPDVAGNIKRPNIEGGGPQDVFVKKSFVLSEYMKYLLGVYEAFEQMRPKEKRENSHIPLVVTGLAKKAALDMRLVDPSLPADPESKSAKAVENIFKYWEDYKEEKYTQVVFADLYQSSKFEGVDDVSVDEEYDPDDDGKKDEDDADDDASDGPTLKLASKRFNLFEWMRDELVKRGVPRDQIAIIHDVGTNDKRREALFERVQSGEVRIVMGTTQLMGIGVNIQRLLKVEHDLDAPWRPADQEQRRGRMIRDGNEAEPVVVLRYGVLETFDATAYQILEYKQKMINQLLSGNVTTQDMDDLLGESVASLAEFRAALTGNPLHKEKFQVEREIASIETSERAFANQIQAERAMVREAKSSNEWHRANIIDQTRRLEELKPFLDGEKAVVGVNGKGYLNTAEDKKEFNKAMTTLALEQASHPDNANSMQWSGPVVTLLGVPYRTQFKRRATLQGTVDVSAAPDLELIKSNGVVLDTWSMLRGQPAEMLDYAQKAKEEAQGSIARSTERIPENEETIKDIEPGLTREFEGAKDKARLEARLSEIKAILDAEDASKNAAADTPEGRAEAERKRAEIMRRFNRRGHILLPAFTWGHWFGTKRTEKATGTEAQSEVPKPRKGFNINPENYRFIERRDIAKASKAGRVLPDALPRLSEAAGRAMSDISDHKTDQVVQSPWAIMRRGGNAVVMAVGNILTDPGLPMTGHVNGAGVYSGDRMEQAMLRIGLWRSRSIEATQGLIEAVSRSLGQNTALRKAAMNMGMSRLFNEAEKAIDGTFVDFDRSGRWARAVDAQKARVEALKEAALNNSDLEQEAAKQEAILNRMMRFSEALDGAYERSAAGQDQRDGVEAAFRAYQTQRNDIASQEQDRTAVGEFIKRAHDRFKQHVVVQLDVAALKALAAEAGKPLSWVYDRTLRQIYGIPDNVVMRPGMLNVGAWVQAKDRNNYGRVLEVDAEAKEAIVLFTNPTTGATATMKFSFDDLEPMPQQASKLPTPDGVSEMHDSTWWKEPGRDKVTLDADDPEQLSIIVEKFNREQVAMKLSPETPRVLETLANPAVRRSHFDTIQFITGKRRQAVNEYFIRVANAELGLSGDDFLSTWEAIAQYAEKFEREAGVNTSNGLAVRRSDASIAMLRDLAKSVSGEMVNTEDHPVIESVAGTMQDVATAMYMPKAAFSTVYEAKDTLVLSVAREGSLIKGITKPIRNTIAILRTMPPAERAKLRELLMGLYATHEHRPTRGAELTGQAVIDNRPQSAHLKIYDDSSMVSWMSATQTVAMQSVGVLRASVRGAANVVYNGRLFGKKIPLVYQTSLEAWARGIRRWGVLANNAWFMERAADLLAVHEGVRMTGQDAAVVSENLWNAGKLRYRIRPDDYASVMASMSGDELASIVGRIKDGDVIRLWGQNWLTGDAPSSQALRRWLDKSSMFEQTSQPTKGTVPMVVQKGGALGAFMRVVMQWQNYSMAYAQQRIPQMRYQRGGFILAGIAGSLFMAALDMFLRDLLRYGLDGAADRWEKRTSDPNQLVSYVSDLISRSSWFGNAEKPMALAMNLLFADGFRQYDAPERAFVSPAVAATVEAFRVFGLGRKILNGDDLSDGDRRLIQQLTIISNLVPVQAILTATGNQPAATSQSEPSAAAGLRGD